MKATVALFVYFCITSGYFWELLKEQGTQRRFPLEYIDNTF